MGRIYIIEKASDVTDHILVLVTNCVEDRFPLGTNMQTEDFIDRLCDDYAEDWDIEKLDSPAVRKIISHAAYIRREMT